MVPIEVRRQMSHKVETADGCLAALDQSGGSTPKALKLYGYPEELYQVGEESMYDAVHSMRTRLVTSPAFQGGQVLGAILFENTLERTISRITSGEEEESREIPFAEYLWKEKQVVPFLKIDKGLCDEEASIQLMKPIPDLEQVLERALESGVFGTKMRSVVHNYNPEGIQACVEQQFALGRRILQAGLTPILEPEINIHSSTREKCEDCLKEEILRHLDSLKEGEKVILKLSLPTRQNLYRECAQHPNCLRMVALSGGYTRDEATSILSEQSNMIASFSRALTEGLQYDMDKEAFDERLKASIGQIFEASRSPER